MKCKSKFSTIVEIHVKLNEIKQAGTFGDRKEPSYVLFKGAYTPPEEVADNSFCWNTRQILKFFWANPKQWFKYQPLDLIRDYFGEKMSFYFAWLGFYTAWLLIATVVGLIVLTISVSTMFSNPAASVPLILIGKQKMPDSYSDFFLQTTDLTLKGPLFFTETTKLLDRPIPASGNLGQRVPPFMFPFLT